MKYINYIINVFYVTFLVITIIVTGLYFYAISLPKIDINNVNLIRIHAVSDNGKRASVMLVTATGKHYVEYG